MYQAGTTSWVDHVWHRCGVYWVFVTPCWWFCDRIVSTHCRSTAGHAKFRWTWQQRKGKETGARGWAMLSTLCNLRHNFSQEDLAMMRFGVNQSAIFKIIQLLDENFGSMHQWVSSLARQDFDSGKCASYFQEPLSWHTCHHRFCGDWDWPLSQPNTQSLTWFDYQRRTFKSCIIYPFTNALQPVGLWRCALWFRL